MLSASHWKLIEDWAVLLRLASEMRWDEKREAHRSSPQKLKPSEAAIDLIVSTLAHQEDRHPPGSIVHLVDDAILP